MRLTDYLPHGPTMSTPLTERERDGIAARHSNYTVSFSHMGFALVICIFVLLTWAVPGFGHDTPRIKSNEETHNINAFWREYIQSLPYGDRHFHMEIDGKSLGT